MNKQFRPPIPLKSTILTPPHDSASNSPQTQWVAMVAQAVAMATMTSQNHGQAILTPYSPLCHRFNTVTWLSIEFPTNPVGCHGGTSRRYGNNDVKLCPKTMAKRFWPPIPLCATVSTLSHDYSIQFPTNPVGSHGGTSRRYGNNDVMFCPKTMAKRFWPPIPLCATVSTLSYDSASNSPQTQWVAMVAQAVAMATMTSCFVQKPWPSDFDPLFSFVPTVSTLSHDSASNSPQTQWVAMVGQARRYGNNDVMFCPKTMAKRFWPPIPLCATVSTLSHDSASSSPQTQWVAMVAQAVAMATMTSCFVQKPWPSDFDPLFPFVPPFQHCHMTQHRIPQSYDSVETVAQRGIGGENRLALVFGQNMTSLLP